MRAKAVTQGGPAPRLRAWAPASARATEKEEFGTICLVQTTSGTAPPTNGGNEWQLTYPTYSILDAALDGSFGAWAGIAIDGSERPLRVQPT